MNDVPIIATQVAILFLSLSVHESSHAWSAWRMGDSTAKMMGRITLNPIKHVDLVGTILLPLSIIMVNLASGGNLPVFGWAKPVPVNPYNFRNPIRGMAWTSFAGPLSNLALMMSGFIFLKFFVRVAQLPQGHPLVIIFLYLLIINAILFLFNLIPLPPLDGAAVLTGFFSRRYGEFIERLGPLSFLILLAILWTGVFNTVISVVIGFLLKWI
jgi:Zn-dependent protease